MTAFSSRAIVVVAVAAGVAATPACGVSTEQASEPPLVSQAQYDRWIDELSNWGTVWSVTRR